MIGSLENYAATRQGLLAKNRRSQTQGDDKQQALLDKRTHMLKIHQRMGLITTIPLIVTVATWLTAGGKSTSTASRDLHAALGGLTGTSWSDPASRTP